MWQKMIPKLSGVENYAINFSCMINHCKNHQKLHFFYPCCCLGGCDSRTRRVGCFGTYFQQQTLALLRSPRAASHSIPKFAREHRLVKSNGSERESTSLFRRSCCKKVSCARPCRHQSIWGLTPRGENEFMCNARIEKAKTGDSQAFSYV